MSNHPIILENKVFIYLYVILWLFVSGIYMLVMSPILSIGVGELALDGLTFSFLTGIFGFFLFYVVRYGHFSSLSPIQCIINYIVLAVIVIGCIVGINLLILYLTTSDDSFTSLYSLIPVKILLALLIYIIFILIYSRFAEKESEEAVEEAPYESIEQKEILERITVKTGQKIQVIPVEEIFYFQAEKDYVMIYTENGKFLKEQTMKSLEEQLPSNKFVRVHRSYIININYISRIESYEKQTQLMILRNGHQAKISQNGYKLLKSVLNL